MNILLTGRSGFVGHYVKQALSQFHTCVPLADGRGTIDLRDVNRIKSFLSSNIQSNNNISNDVYNVKSAIAPKNILPDINSDDITSNDITDITIASLFNTPLHTAYTPDNDISENKFNITSLRNTLHTLPHAAIFDAVIHLAAQSFVPESFKNPLETFDVNFTGTYNLFSALKEYGFHGKILYISSGDIYGLVSEDKLPITEDYPLKPRNPYAVSKVAAEALCYQWSITEDIEIVIARPFNHIGPNQSERFAVSSFAKQIAEIELGLRKPVLNTGNIDITRDFLDVRDVAGAYKLLLEKGMNCKEQESEIDIKTESSVKTSAKTNVSKEINALTKVKALTKKDAKEIKTVENSCSYVYNVCSETETSIRSIINIMFEITGVDAKIEIDKNKLRPNEQKRVYGSNEKIKNITGWEPKIPLKQSMADILYYWKEKLKN
ncbi:MAG: GDP-mannose 4,6-dehydratase [bacterium]